MAWIPTDSETKPIDPSFWQSQQLTIFCSCSILEVSSSETSMMHSIR